MSDPDGSNHTAVTLDDYWRLTGPFFHGTRASLHVGDELVPGHVSNLRPARVMNNIYFAALLNTAVWGAELAAALAGRDQPGYVYEDDPNVTNKRFPGNVTQSYRSRHPLRVMRQVRTFQRHDREALEDMLHALRLLREQGRDVIED